MSLPDEPGVTSPVAPVAGRTDTRLYSAGFIAAAACYLTALAIGVLTLTIAERGQN